jgi:hypothetical protein
LDGFEGKMLVYLMAIWTILPMDIWTILPMAIWYILPMAICYNLPMTNLAYFVAIWYTFPALVCLDPEKSGNPAPGKSFFSSSNF